MSKCLGVLGEVFNLTPEERLAEEQAAIKAEPEWYVDALLDFAFASPTQTYEMVSTTVAGFTSKSKKTESYKNKYHAAARVALERSHPVLFQEWLAGNDSEEIKVLVGAELAKLRPAQLVFKKSALRPRRVHKAQNAA